MYEIRNIRRGSVAKNRDHLIYANLYRVERDPEGKILSEELIISATLDYIYTEFQSQRFV